MYDFSKFCRATMDTMHLLLFVYLAISSVALAQDNETCSWDFTKYASSEVDTGLCESPVSKDEIFVDGECHNSSEFGFYRAACDIINGGSQIFFLDVYCELDDCSNCRDSVADDPSSFIQSGHGYRRGCHSSTEQQDVNTFSYDFLGICDTDSSCYLVPPEVRGEEVDDSTLEIAPIVDDSDACSFQIEYYGAANSITARCDGTIQNETNINADGECNFDPLIGHYRAACSKDGGSKIKFSDANCENDDCTDCSGRTSGTSNNVFIESGETYPIGCHYIENMDEQTDEKNAIAHSFTIAGSCSSDLSCQVVNSVAPPEETSGAPSEFTEVRGEEVDGSTPAIAPIVEDDTSGAPSEVTEVRGEEVDNSTPEIAPIVEDSDACSFQIEYYGAANSRSAICDDIIQNETNINADGECNFDPLIGYYRAACSTDGGSKLIFLNANCENGCTNCGGRDTSGNVFIESKDEFSIGCHYIKNTDVEGAIAHSFTVAGSCSSDLSCLVKSSPETNTVAGAHTPTGLKNDSSGRSSTPSFVNALLCVAFWVYVAAF